MAEDGSEGGHFLSQELKVKREGDTKEKLGSGENLQILGVSELGDTFPAGSGVLCVVL